MASVHFLTIHFMFDMDILESPDLKTRLGLSGEEFKSVIKEFHSSLINSNELTPVWTDIKNEYNNFLYAPDLEIKRDGLTDMFAHQFNFALRNDCNIAYNIEALLKPLLNKFEPKGIANLQKALELINETNELTNDWLHTRISIFLNESDGLWIVTEFTINNKPNVKEDDAMFLVGHNNSTRHGLYSLVLSPVTIGLINN